MDINLEFYKTFFTVAKHQSMTKAAEILMVSQPAVSKAIKTLEEQIGVSLFNRSSKGLELTEEGKMLYQRIAPALLIIQNAENELTEFKDLNEGEIKIGVSSVLTKSLLLDTISSFRVKYPKIKIKIVNGLTETLISELNEGKLDFIIYNESDVDEKTVEKKELTKLSYSFFYNPVFFNIENINLDKLNDYPLILQNKNSNTRKYLDAFTKDSLVPEMEVVSQDLICNFVNCGMGIGFAFDKIIDLVNPSLQKIKFKEIPDTSIYIAKNKSTKLSFAAKTFVNELKNNL